MKNMKNNKLLDRHPSVQITKNRNELKVYQSNIIYLNNGDNFELNFFNPLQQKIGVSIEFNGVKKGESYLVLNPGQNVFLDRFLDEQRKMLFDTYDIDENNKEAVDAIEKNGLITFNFYNEYYINNNKNEVNVNYNFPPIPNNCNYIGYLNSNSVNNTGTSYSNYYANSTITLSGDCCSSTHTFNQFDTSNSNSRYCSDMSGIYNVNAKSCNSLNNLSFGVTGNIGIGNNSSTSNLNINSTSTSLNNIIETGRIEKGELSNQKLKNVNVEFSNNSFYSISYKLMPYSSKSKSINEIREYCTCCAYRLRKSSWKFCPKCGTKI